MKKPTAEVLAEQTGDTRTESEAATHFVIETRPCYCDAHDDHLQGEQ